MALLATRRSFSLKNFFREIETYGGNDPEVRFNFQRGEERRGDDGDGGGGKSRSLKVLEERKLRFPRSLTINPKLGIGKGGQEGEGFVAISRRRWEAR